MTSDTKSPGGPEPQPTVLPPFVLPKHSEDETGFESIFDGNTLKDWEGDPIYWRAERGSIVGETKPDTLLIANNSFVIWRGGVTRDFELRLRYRITPEGNSGVNYRSEEMLEPKWTMRGYQFDIDGPNWGRYVIGKHLGHFDALAQLVQFRITGQNYEELGRQFIALPGQITQLEAGDVRRVIARANNRTHIEDVTQEDWNDVRIIARANVLLHILNGHLTSMVIDDDLENRKMDGKLGMQVHAGPPMKVEFSNIRIKRL